MQLSEDQRNARLQLLIDALGATGKLRIYSGAAPATPEDAPTGTLLVEIDLPATPFTTPAAGAMSKSGTWEDTGAATDTAGYYRFDDNSDVTHAQGSCSGVEGGGELQLLDPDIVTSETVTVASWTWTAGNA